MSCIRERDTSVNLELGTVLPEHGRFLFLNEKEGQQIEEYAGDNTL
jgi:hypothetical protein